MGQEARGRGHGIDDVRDVSMKIGRLNHVGVATPDVKAAAKTYAELMAQTDATEAKDFPHLGVRVIFVSVPNMQIELIEPLGDGQPDPQIPGEEPERAASTICALKSVT